ncbi:methyl-accepting chemotaxis protein [Halovivax gelatinilyticus]|uniref:methyl-accepting chemotaxis protein n=1 Tax=Halovivax gelatinilyticus TaxID=2961597 RepID=UPI0020CA5405|nr:methyl-accepting chemotaxis protein [Halovivax gelatinilyticus]
MGALSIQPITGLRSRFTVKLVLLLLIVAVVVGGFGGLIYAQTDAALEDDIEQKFEQSAVLQAETIEEGLAANQRQAGLIAQSSAVQSGDTETIGDFFDAQLASMDESVAGIHLVDTEQQTIDVTTTGAEGSDASALPWSTLAYDPSGPQMIGPYRDDHVGTTVGAITMDVDADTRVVLLIDMVALSERLEHPTASEQSGIHVITDTGIVVMSHNTDAIGLIDHHHMDIEFPQQSGYKEIDMDAMDHDDHVGYDAQQDAIEVSVILGLGGEIHEMEGHGGHTIYAPGSTHEALMDVMVDIDHDGTMSMGYAHVDGADWVVMSHEPRSDAFALQSDITQSVIGLVLVSFLGLGLIGVVVGRNTSRSLKDLAGSAREVEDGNLETSIESSRKDEIGQLYRAFDNMRLSLRESIEETEAARDRAEDRGEELARLATHLEAKAEDFREVMVSAGDGDLTARMDATSENESMEAIASEYNQMVDDIETTVDELKRFAEEVATHSEEVTASSEEVQTASGRVTESVQEISTQTDKQHETYRTVVDRMEDLSATTEEIASLSNEVAGIAERTATAGETGKEAASDAVTAMNAVDEDADAAVTEIERLQSKIIEIEEITDSIQQVAKQTNMLALNANIEASRSGEADEGFSAVAEEVKELATDVQDSAAEIDELVDEIGDQTDRTADEVRDTRKEVSRNADAVAEAIDALDEIATYATQTHDGTQEISAASEEQAASIENVVELVDEAESLSQQVSEEASSAAAAAEEQTTALSEVTDSASDLASRSGSLQERLDEFETGGNPQVQPTTVSDD